MRQSVDDVLSAIDGNTERNARDPAAGGERPQRSAQHFHRHGALAVWPREIRRDGERRLEIAKRQRKFGG